jgi:hypothetical protein
MQKFLVLSLLFPVVSGFLGVTPTQKAVVSSSPAFPPRNDVDVNHRQVSFRGVCFGDRYGVSTQLYAGSSSDSTGPVKLIIAGAPASGKGTQCEVIKEKFGVVHLSTGDMLRAAVAAQTTVGKQAKDYMDSGKLVPDDVIIGVVSTVVPCKEKNNGSSFDQYLCSSCFIVLTTLVSFTTNYR